MPKQNYDDDDDDLLMALQSMEPCGNCGADGAKIPCMSGCGSIFYCSRECGMHHASAHRLRCRNLRCSKFNDSDSESGSEYSDEFSDDSDEYETDSGDDDDEEEEEEVKPKKGGGGGGGGGGKKGKGKGKGKGRRKMTRTDSADAGGGGGGGGGGRVMLDSEVERRIEEKIMRRLKKQEENRIAQAIEQRMREEKANWRDDEMNRIIMEMRERFQKELGNSEFMSHFVKKNGHSLEAQSSSDMLIKFQAAAAAATAAGTDYPANPQAEGKESAFAGAGGGAATMANGMLLAGGGSSSDDDASAARMRGMSKESSWNNACRDFEALRVVVWKHSFLPRMVFAKNDTTGIWNRLVEVDGDESFSHIAAGDALLSVNGREVDANVQTEDDLADILAGFASPLILKFEAADPYSGKVHDYTVTWSNGPLGVTLKDDCTNQKVPIVNRLTKKSGSVAVKQNIAIGDILVAINNIDTIQLGCSLSMSILKKVQLPAKLKFRGVGGPSTASGGHGDDDENGMDARKASENGGTSTSMTRPATYVVNWGEGPLGLTIIPGMDEDDLPVIKKVTGTGTSAGIESAQIGDFLETMNEISTAGMPFEDVVAYLKSAPKPVLLRFRSAAGDEYGEAAPAVVLPPPAPVREISRAPSAKSTTSSLGAASVASSASARTSPVPSPAKPYAAPSPSSQIVHDEIRDNYKVVWGDGPLGLTIDAREDVPTGAYIKRIASTGAASRLSQDCIGDFLTHINDMDVARLQFQDIVGQLKNMPRPVTLFFKRRPVSEKRGFAQSASVVSMSSVSSVSSAGAPAQAAAAAHDPRGRLTDTPARGRKPSAHEEAGIHYYNVVWQDGTPLGLSLRGADNTSDYPYITRVTGNGSAAHLPNSVVGDSLVSVDGRSVHVRDKTFDEVMTMLKNMPKPVTLKFQARQENHPRGGSSSGMHAAAGVHNGIPPGYPTSSSMPSQHHLQQQQQQASHTWRQNRGGDLSSSQLQPQHYARSQPHMMPSASASSLPTPGGVLASSLMRQNSNLQRSFMTQQSGNERALDTAAGNEDKFASIQSPFLVQNKLSTGRRQKMLKGLKK